MSTSIKKKQVRKGVTKMAGRATTQAVRPTTAADFWASQIGEYDENDLINLLTAGEPNYYCNGVDMSNSSHVRATRERLAAEAKQANREYDAAEQTASRSGRASRSLTQRPRANGAAKEREEMDDFIDADGEDDDVETAGHGGFGGADNYDDY